MKCNVKFKGSHKQVLFLYRRALLGTLQDNAIITSVNYEDINMIYIEQDVGIQPMHQRHKGHNDNAIRFPRFSVARLCLHQDTKG